MIIKLNAKKKNKHENQQKKMSHHGEIERNIEYTFDSGNANVTFVEKKTICKYNRKLNHFVSVS